MDKSPVITIFGVSVPHLGNLVDVILSAYEGKISATLSSLDSSARRKAVEDLDAIGFFELRGAAIKFARRACISKVTAYKDLKQILWEK